MMKVIAFYLPQFHDIPENDEWWGKGFTEWVNVKKATPLYEGHDQPRVPLNDNYYNLLDDDVKVWQAKIAKEHGVYGFCYYHYWFNGKKLLEKPMEQMLSNKDVDLPFCICWANEPWTKAWVGKKEVLLPQHYGNEKEWKEHFDYLLPFFKDERYIMDDGKPLMVIYRAEVIPRLNDMLDYWDNLAKENGLNGLTYAYQDVAFDFIEDKDDSRFKYNIEFQPIYSWMDMVDKSKIKSSKIWKKMRSIKRNLYVAIEHLTGFDIERKLQKDNVKEVAKVDFDEAWQTILDRQPNSDKNVPGAFVGWDNTPRKGANGKVYVGDSPEKLKKYMSQQIKNAKEKYNKDMIFMYAWNEWAEGGYLEPDTRTGFGNLEAIRDALKENDEFPW